MEPAAAPRVSARNEASAGASPATSQRRGRRRAAALVGLGLAAAALCWGPRTAQAFQPTTPATRAAGVGAGAGTGGRAAAADVRHGRRQQPQISLSAATGGRTGNGHGHSHSGGNGHHYQHQQQQRRPYQQQHQQQGPPLTAATAAAATADLSSIREVNRRISFWGKQRDFGQVQALLQRMEAGGLRPNVYTLNALVGAAVACHRGEQETRLLWQRCVAQGVRPTAVTYNIMLKRYFGHRSPTAQRRALALLDEMRHEGVEPDVLTFNELVNICVEGGDMAAATGLLKAMLHRGLRPDATTYTTLIKGYGLKGNLVSAFDTVKEMRAQSVPLSTYSCNVLADACIRCGQPGRALRLYRDFEAGTARDFPGDEPTRQLDARSFNIMLKAHREMGALEGALGTLAAMKARGLEPDVVTYNTLVDAYCKAQRPQGARALVGEMAAKGFPVTHQTLHPLLQEEITSQALPLEAVLALGESILGEYGLRPTHVTVCTVMEAMLAMERPADAIAAFMRSYSPETKATPSLVAYNGLVKAYREAVLAHDEEGDGEAFPALRCLAFDAEGAAPPAVIEARTPQEVLSAVLPLPAYLRASAAAAAAASAAEGGGGGSSSSSGGGSSGVKPDSITYNVLMDFAAELGDTGALEAVERERAAAGFPLDHYVIHSQMKAHAARGGLQGVTEAKERMESLRIAPNERTFSVLVLSLLRCGQEAKAALLLRNALSRQLYVHDSLFAAFIQHHTTGATGTGAKPDLEAARAVFDAYRARRTGGGGGGALQRKWAVAVWNAWLGALAAQGDTGAVQEAIEAMEAQAGLRPTRTSYAMAVRAACVAGDTDGAMRWLGALRQRRFAPDVRIYNWIIYACLAQPGAQRTAHLAEVVAAMEREGVQPNAVTQRAKAQILGVLASRMRSVSGAFARRLSLTLDLKKKAEDE